MVNMTKTNSTESIEDKVEQTSNQDMKLSQILDRLSKLEEENTQLKKKEPVDPKKKYDWPSSYSYKLWGWIPVCDYTSKKKDETRSLSYENVKGEVVDNHIMELKLADWTTIKTLMTEFHKGYTKTEQEFPIEVRTKDWQTYYKFKKDWKEFEISKKIIN